MRITAIPQKYFRHKKLTLPSEKDSPGVKLSREWLIEVKCSSEAIRILSTSTTKTCSLRGIIVETLQNPTVEANIMLAFLAETLLGKMLQVSTNKLFKSPSGFIFKCCGIRAVPVIIDEIKVHLDFHIFAILEFDLLIGYPLENFFKKNLLMGALMKSWEQLLPPLLSRWRSNFPIITRSRT